MKIFISQNKFESEITVAGDDLNSVEAQLNEKNEERKSSNLWRTFSNIVDRFLFVSITIIYIVMLLSLLPENFLNAAQNVNSVEIIGY